MMARPGWGQRRVRFAFLRYRLGPTLRRLAIVAAAIGLAACSGTGGAAPLASGAPPSPVAASPAPSPVQPIVLSGTNSKVTDPMTIPPGNYRVSWQASGDSNFAIWIQGQQKSLLVNEILPNPNSGEVL